MNIIEDVRFTVRSFNKDGYEFYAIICLECPPSKDAIWTDPLDNGVRLSVLVTHMVDHMPSGPLAKHGSIRP